jgi:hypothetical protein
MRYPPEWTKDVPHGSKVDHFDRGRGELYIKMFCPYDLTEVDTVDYVGGLFEASYGDPAVKAVLLDSPFDWLPDAEAKALRAKFRALWNGFENAPPAIDGLRTLRELRSGQRPLPEGMETALFDDPAFDAVAYVDEGKCGNCASCLQRQKALGISVQSRCP